MMYSRLGIITTTRKSFTLGIRSSTKKWCVKLPSPFIPPLFIPFFPSLPSFSPTPLFLFSIPLSPPLPLPSLSLLPPFSPSSLPLLLSPPPSSLPLYPPSISPSLLPSLTLPLLPLYFLLPSLTLPLIPPLFPFPPPFPYPPFIPPSISPSLLPSLTLPLSLYPPFYFPLPPPFPYSPSIPPPPPPLPTWRYMKLPYVTVHVCPLYHPRGILLIKDGPEHHQWPEHSQEGQQLLEPA